MHNSGIVRSTSNLGLFTHPPKGLILSDVISMGLPHKNLENEVKNWRKENLSNLWRGLTPVFLGRLFHFPIHYGALYLTKQTPHNIPDKILTELLQEYVSLGHPQQGISFPYFAKEKGFSHKPTFLGLASFRVVTTTGVGFIVDAWQNIVELESMIYHGLGTGSTAEAAGDTALVTELTTEYTGNVRATGSTTEGASANIFRTVATNTLDGTPGAALREHGLFSQAALAGGVLMDRTVYAAVTLSSGESLQTTYDNTQNAGS